MEQAEQIVSEYEYTEHDYFTQLIDGWIAGNNGAVFSFHNALDACANMDNL